MVLSKIVTPSTVSPKLSLITNILQNMGRFFNAEIMNGFFFLEILSVLHHATQRFTVRPGIQFLHLMRGQPWHNT